MEFWVREAGISFAVLWVVGSSLECLAAGLAGYTLCLTYTCVPEVAGDLTSR